MKELLDREGCRTELMVAEGANTGTCAVLVSAGANRSMVTRLDAANLYKYSHLISDKVWSILQESSFFYVSVCKTVIDLVFHRNLPLFYFHIQSTEC